jgi:hypothetical protein
MPSKHFPVNLQTNQGIMRGWVICFFLNLFVCFYAKSQQTFTTATPYKQDKQGTFYDSSHKNVIAPRTADIRINVNLFPDTSVKTVPSTFYFNSIGFFCQKELQIEKAVGHAVKFRLGSVAYTDEIEGKGKKWP